MGRVKKYTAMVVDDDFSSLESIYEYLQISFTTVFKAKSAEEALKLLKRLKPDIIFTDIVMPNMDGFEFIDKIREHNTTVPIVVMSAYDDKEKLLHAIKIDIIDYLVKPLTSQKLKNAISLSLEKLDALHVKVHLGDNLVWNKGTSTLFHKERLIPLSNSETKLLGILLANMHQAIESTVLFDAVWDDYEREYNSRSIRSLISRLRKKLVPACIIKNIYGSKYLLEVLGQDGKQSHDS